MPIETKDDEIDILVLLSILIKNIKWILIIPSITAFIIVLVSIISLKLPPEKNFLPNLYTSKTIVILNSSNNSGGGLGALLGDDSGLSALAGLAGMSDSSSGPSDADLAMELVKMNSFISKLNSEFNLENIYKTVESEHPKTRLRQAISDKLKVSLDEESGLLNVSYTDTNKILATEIVNKVTDLLEEEFYKIDKIRNSNQYALVEEKKAIVEAEMRRLQQDIISFQYKHNILDVEVVSEEIISLISGLQSQLLNKEVQIESYGKFANERDPSYIRLLNEREAILKSIKKLENGEVGDYPPIKDIPKLALQLEELKQKLEVQLIGYKALIQQSETLKLTAEGTGATFQVLQYAEIPEIKSGPSRGKLCIFATIASIFLTILFIYAKEAVVNIKNDPEKMARLRGDNAK